MSEAGLITEGEARINTVKIRDLTIGDGIPKICVPLVADCMDGLRTSLSELAGQDFDLVEFRADFFADRSMNNLDEALSLIREEIGEKPLLFTVRTSSEGGAFGGDPQQYRDMLLFTARSGKVDLVDVELHFCGSDTTTLVTALHKTGVKVVGSCHDFEKTPSAREMAGILCQMQRIGMDITKLAVMPRCREDVLRLLEATAQMRERFADRPFITMSMGDLGRISRVTGSFSGSAVTFASAGQTSAPGQMDTRQVRSLLESLSFLGS